MVAERICRRRKHIAFGRIPSPPRAARNSTKTASAGRPVQHARCRPLIDIMGGETTFALNNISPITLAFAGQSVWRDAAAFACLCGFARRGVGLGDGFLFCARAVAKSAGHSPLPMNAIRM